MTQPDTPGRRFAAFLLGRTTHDDLPPSDTQERGWWRDFWIALSGRTGLGSDAARSTPDRDDHIPSNTSTDRPFQEANTESDRLASPQEGEARRLAHEIRHLLTPSPPGVIERQRLRRLGRAHSRLMRHSPAPLTLDALVQNFLTANISTAVRAEQVRYTKHTELMTQKLSTLQAAAQLLRDGIERARSTGADPVPARTLGETLGEQNIPDELIRNRRKQAERRIARTRLQQLRETEAHIYSIRSEIALAQHRSIMQVEYLHASYAARLSIYRQTLLRSLPPGLEVVMTREWVLDRLSLTILRGDEYNTLSTDPRSEHGSSTTD